MPITQENQLTLLVSKEICKPNQVVAKLPFHASILNLFKLFLDFRGLT